MIATFGAATLAPASPAQSRPGDPNESLPPELQSSNVLRQSAQRLLRAVRGLGDWNEQYAYLSASIEQVYEKNGWDSEPDLFSLDAIREISRIPPWQVQDRLDALTELVGDRYLLDEGQKASFQALLMREAFDAFRENAPRILQYAPEALAARAAGEPFTPQQVARWTKLASPVFRDVRKRFERASREFVAELDPDQRELVQADLEASVRRLNDVERMSREWMQGKWSAADWGLERDPIQNPDGGAEALAEADHESEAVDAPGSSAAAPAPASRPAPAGEDLRDPWALYVKEFILRYQLDDEQQQRAWLYYHDARRRAEIIGAHGAVAGSRPSGAAPTRREADLERLFESLKRRLDRLPTRGQRKLAESRPAPTSAPAQRK